MARDDLKEGRRVLSYCRKYGKPMYDKRGAETAKNHRYEMQHVRLRIYQCDYCDYWHLTSKLRGKRK